MIGKTVREARINLGMTQTEFSALVGITQSHISMIEKGKRKPKIETVRKIARALDLDVEKLIQTGGIELESDN